jgi:hypothetical protein
MALVPIRCPSCGAAVELEEDQQIVRCAYCKVSSYLPQPAALAHLGGVQTEAAADAGRKSYTSTLVVLGLVVVPLVAGVGFLVTKGGVGADYMRDASAVEGVLRDGLGPSTRYLKISLSGRHTYAEELRSDDIVMVHRYDGAMARTPKPNGKSRQIGADRARAFTVGDVDFAVVASIVEDATKRSPGGVPRSATLEARESAGDLRWTVSVDVMGDSVTHQYSPAGKYLPPPKK